MSQLCITGFSCVTTAQLRPLASPLPGRGAGRQLDMVSPRGKEPCNCKPRARLGDSVAFSIARQSHSSACIRETAESKGSVPLPRQPVSLQLSLHPSLLLGQCTQRPGRAVQRGHCLPSAREPWCPAVRLAGVRSPAVLACEHRAMSPLASWHLFASA